MRSTSNQNSLDWSFTPAIEYIQSYVKAQQNQHSGSHDGFSGATDALKIASEIGRTKQVEDTESFSRSRDISLGNFEELWKYLRSRQTPSLPVQHKEEDAVSDAGSIASKGVHWRDELDGAELADTDELEPSYFLAGLTKTQRKKARRKERRAAQEQSFFGNHKHSKTSSESDSDAQDLIKGRHHHQSPLGRKSVIHDLLGRPLPEQRSSNSNSFGVLSNSVPVPGDVNIVPKTILSNGSAQKVYDSQTEALLQNQRLSLVKLIKQRFAATSPYLEELDLLSDITPIHAPIDQNIHSSPDGIHIFIDASNIMIGFHDALKHIHKIPPTRRLPRQRISFEALSMILTRGRPTAKRVVVGSDKVPEIDQARLIGYETSILDRVQKAKELTPRKHRSSHGNGYGTQSAGSGSESAAAIQYAPEKWVEQAVDEILHLKMMESIVDASEPSTMVLATGDAAEAEYSGGFLKMVERALLKGWKVELASFRQNTSHAYQRHDFRQRWDGHFDIVELDDFTLYLRG